MQTFYDKDTGVKTWYVENWYQKFFYIIGILFTFFWVACFTLGFIIGILEL